MRRLLKTDLKFARPLPKSEEHVDCEGLQLFMGATVDVEVGKRKYMEARIVIKRDEITNRSGLVENLIVSLGVQQNESEY